MIDQYRGHGGKQVFRVSCDLCTTIEDYNADDWQELMGLMQDLGWKNKNKDGTWVHFCPDCQAKINERLNR